MKTIPAENMLVKDFIAQLRVAEPRSRGSLTVCPILTSRPLAAGYAILDEVLSAGAFTISEVSEGGSVPELKVVNKSGLDVLILDGEQLIGAKQNRIVNASMIIGKGMEMVIPVSCVEQSRWNYKSRNFSSSPSILYAALRKKKSKDVIFNLLKEKSFRSDQGGIWDDIEAKEKRLKYSSKTNAMDDMYVRFDGDIKNYEATFTHLDNQVGFIALIGNAIAGADLFSSPELFQKVYGKLLRSYIMDAIEQPASSENETSTQKGTLKRKAAYFLRRLPAIKSASYKSTGLGSDIRIQGRTVHGAALVNNDQVVHLAAFAE